MLAELGQIVVPGKKLWGELSKKNAELFDLVVSAFA